MRYGSKEELLSSIQAERDRLLDVLGRFSRDELHAGGVWGDGWTLKDLVAHLNEWHAMFLGWYRDGLAGRQPDMPASGYKWNETPRLNRDIWTKHRDRSWEDVRVEFERSCDEILKLVQGLSEEALFEPGHFTWTGRNPLTTYLGANTASHYRFAIKVIKRWQRRAP